MREHARNKRELLLAAPRAAKHQIPMFRSSRTHPSTPKTPHTGPPSRAWAIAISPISQAANHTKERRERGVWGLCWGFGEVDTIDTIVAASIFEYEFKTRNSLIMPFLGFAYSFIYQPVPPKKYNAKQTKLLSGSRQAQRLRVEQLWERGCPQAWRHFLLRPLFSALSFLLSTSFAFSILSVSGSGRLLARGPGVARGDPEIGNRREEQLQVWLALQIIYKIWFSRVE